VYKCHPAPHVLLVPTGPYLAHSVLPAMFRGWSGSSLRPLRVAVPSATEKVRLSGIGHTSSSLWSAGVGWSFCVLGQRAIPPPVRDSTATRHRLSVDETAGSNRAVTSDIEVRQRVGRPRRPAHMRTSRRSSLAAPTLSGSLRFSPAARPWTMTGKMARGPSGLLTPQSRKTLVVACSMTRFVF
jgi:hypothetical protein